MAGGDPGLFEIGKISIKNLAGKSVPEGAFRKLVAAARRGGGAAAWRCRPRERRCAKKARAAEAARARPNPMPIG